MFEGSISLAGRAGKLSLLHEVCVDVYSATTACPTLLECVARARLINGLASSFMTPVNNNSRAVMNGSAIMK